MADPTTGTTPSGKTTTTTNVPTGDQQVAQTAQQAAEKAAQQVADQVAQTIAQAVRELSGETTRNMVDAVRTASSQEVGAEREFETGMDEAYKHLNILSAQNAKRSYDEYQHESLEAIRRNRTLVDRMAGLSVDHDQQVRQLSAQALQNAVETANMIGKQAVRHGDIAIDNQWNPVTEGAGNTLTARAVSLDDASLKAIGAAVAAAVAQAIQPNKA